MTAAKPDELRDAVRANRTALVSAAIASGLINVLMLTGPLFMLQVYDRVLPSRSIPTLVGLGLFALDALCLPGRARSDARAAAAAHRPCARRAAQPARVRPRDAQRDAERRAAEDLQPLRDLDTIRALLLELRPLRVVRSAVGAALCGDLLPVSSLARLRGADRRARALRRHAAHRKRDARTDARTHRARRRAASSLPKSARRNAGIVQRARHARPHGGTLERGERRLSAPPAGDHRPVGRLRQRLAHPAPRAAIRRARARRAAGDRTGGKRRRHHRGDDHHLARARADRARDRQLALVRRGAAKLARGSPMRSRRRPPSRRACRFPPPRAVAARHRAQRRCRREARRSRCTRSSFALNAGTALGIIGPSGSGKSSLARALAGIWKPARGVIRLDGATPDQWSPDALGRSIGYLPQEVELFAGTVAENIARFETDADPAQLIAAAKTAGVHEMILRLPNGYETQVGDAGSLLSGGQRQRVALARALYGDPFLVILDEPNSNLDARGEQALTGAIDAVRARGGIAIVIAHRPSAVRAVDHVLILNEGRMQAFGARDKILGNQVQPAQPEAACATRAPSPRSQSMNRAWLDQASGDSCAGRRAAMRAALEARTTSALAPDGARGGHAILDPQPRHGDRADRGFPCDERRRARRHDACRGRRDRARLAGGRVEREEGAASGRRRGRRTDGRRRRARRSRRIAAAARSDRGAGQSVGGEQVAVGADRTPRAARGRARRRRDGRVSRRSAGREATIPTSRAS